MKLLLALFTLLNFAQAEIRLPDNFTSNFNQVITNDSGKTITYAGKVLFQNMKQVLVDENGYETSYTRSLFKWDYSMPTQKEVCTDGLQLVVVDHDLEQISNYNIENGINLEEILKLGQKLTRRSYQATYKEVEYLITLNEEEALKKIVYIDNLDNKVKIVFENMIYNSPYFSIDQLECQRPKDYDIIEG